MSAESTWDVQAGIYARLAGYTALTTQLSGGANAVLDHVPQGKGFPYVVMGETSATPLDTQVTSGNEVHVTLHSYSREPGMQELKKIMVAVYDALHHASFSIPNQTLILCRWLGAETRLESDGVTRHGQQHFQIITEPA